MTDMEPENPGPLLKYMRSRNADRIKQLTAERDQLRAALEYILAECTLSDNTMPSVGAIKYAARAALKGESHE